MPRRLTQSPGSGAAKPVERTALQDSLRLLASRGRTTAELDRALAERGHPPSARREALSRLEELGYVNDTRFARERAASLLREGRSGERFVLKKLERHGLSRELARQALDAAMEELGFDPLAAARALLARRGLLDVEEGKGVARAVRLLGARGFSAEVIARCLPAATLDPTGQGD